MAKALCQSFVLIHFSQISYIKSTIFPNKSRIFSRILMKINHYADLDELYNSGFECEKIESAVRPQIHENGRSALHPAFSLICGQMFRQICLDPKDFR